MTAVSHCEAIPANPGDHSARQFTKAERLHVLTLTPFYPAGNDDAAGCFIAEPVASLAKLGVRSTVIAARPWHRAGHLTSNGKAHPATWVRYVAVPGVVGLAVSGTALYRKLRAAVRRLHEAEPLSLVHAHSALPCGHAAALLGQELGVPFIVTVHGRDTFSSKCGGLPGRWCERVSKQVFRAAERVVCISEKVEEDLRAGVQCRSSVVPNGVDTEIFSPQEFRESDPVVLSVGNLIRSKGHEMLLQSMATIIPRHPRLRCQIIGVGPEQNRLAGIAQQLGVASSVEFLGWQSRAAVAEAMQRCSVFVLPSSYEGLGCVYLEAMASGKPAIGCTGQGIAEVIRSGENGWLVAPGDTETLSQVIERLLMDACLRQRIGSAARRTVVNNFTVQRQAERLFQVYTECIP